MKHEYQVDINNDSVGTETFNLGLVDQGEAIDKVKILLKDYYEGTIASLYKIDRVYVRTLKARN